MEAPSPLSPELRIQRSRGALLQWLTILHASLEGIAALYASVLAGSVALLSFGMDSGIEMLSASIALWRILSIGRPRQWMISDRNGLRLVGVCFFTLAATILWDAVRALAIREIPKETWLGIIIAVISVLAMPVLAHAKRRISGELGSGAMRADARQTDFCAYLAAILLVGLLLYRMLGWWWADPVAAILMTPIITWEGILAMRGHHCECAG